MSPGSCDSCPGLFFWGVVVRKRGVYTFSASKADGPAILTDNATGISVDLSEKTYEVSLSAGEFNTRFTLNKEGVITSSEDIITTEFDLNEIIDVYDILGRLLKTDIAFKDIKSLPKGVYILKGATSTQKIAVK